MPLALTSPCAPPPIQAAAESDGSRESFEEFLARARTMRDAQQAKLSAQVRESVARMDAQPSGARGNETERALNELVALGPDATPLLLPYLDPGANATDHDRARSTRCAQALSRMDTTPITEKLLAMLPSATDEGKKNALLVLETTRERARVEPRLYEAFKSAQGPLKLALLRTLFAIGGSENAALVSEVLLGNDVEQTKLALAAMIEGRNTHIVAKVDELLVDPKKAAPVIREVLAFFRAVPEAVHEEEVKLLIALAGNSSDMQVEDRIEILGTISYTGIKLSPDLRKGLEGISAARDRRIREAALVALVCLGDRGARKDLLAEYDDRVRRNGSWSQSFSDRATVLYRIRDWDAAAKDYMQALVIQNNNQDASAKPELYIGLAKSYAMLGKLKESSDWLEKAPIGFDELKTLAQDPAFAKLKEHPKYGSIFRGAAGN